MRTLFRGIRRGAVILVSGAAVVALLLWLMGAFNDRVPPAPTSEVLPRKPADALTVVVRSVEVPLYETAVGTISPVHKVALGSMLLARVTVMHVKKAGEARKKGEVLVELDDKDLKARFEEANAAHDAAVAESEQARIDLARIEQLFKQGVVSRDRLDQATTQSRTAEAQVAQAAQATEVARTTLSYAKILSPLDGIVIDKHVEQGDLVSPGQVLVTLYDPSRMELVARVRESMAMKLSPGRTVEVRIEALDKTCSGTVDQIVPEAQAQSRIFEVKVTGPCPPGVYAGMFGRLRMSVGTRQEIRIPIEAVRAVGQIETVFVVLQNGTTIRRFIQAGRRTGAEIEILSGLAPGETILARAN